MKTAQLRTHVRRILVAASIFVAACWMPCTLQGAGLAVFKQQPFHSDDLAEIIVFASIRRDALTCYLDLGSKEFNCPVTKIVETLEVPYLPGTIRSKEAVAQVRQLSQEMNAFAARYKKAVPILKPYMDQFTAALRRLDAGEVLYGGRWLSSIEYARVAEGEAKTSQMIRQGLKDEEKAYQEAAQRAEQFAIEQRNKGLELYGQQWLPKAEAAALRQRDREMEAAAEQVKAKSVAQMTYSVFQKISAGLLVVPITGKAANFGLNYELVLLRGIEQRTTVAGDVYRDDVYWCGTYSYSIGAGQEKTIHAYSVDWEDAVTQARKSIFDEPQEKEPDPRQIIAANRPQPAAPSALSLSDALERASGSGSGFFVGNEGYFVTNAHVAGSTSRVHIYHRDKMLPARVIHASKIVDLALLKTEEAVDGLALAEEEGDLGQDVFAIGFPNPDIQGVGIKVTKGVISSQSGIYDDHTKFQIDAAIQPGNSGGPLCDASGQVVGVVVSTLSAANLIKNGRDIPQNVNYAIKASELGAFLRSRSVKVQRGTTSPAPGSSQGVKAAVAAVGLVIVNE